MHAHEHIPAEQAEQFWDDRYSTRGPKSSGQPSAILRRFAEDLPKGHALELGCARGDDAIWLATLGWKVTAVDISSVALEFAKGHAKDAEVDKQIEFQQHDLAKTFPDGSFDLVSAMFLQTPVAFPRAEVLRRAAEAVAPNGMLLIVSHGSRPHWASPDTPFDFSTPEEALAELQLNSEDWEEVFLGAPERIATAPDGSKGPILDTVVALRRL